MPNRMISFKDDIFLMLKQEDNASGLIDSLLRYHYEQSDNPKEKLERTMRIIEEKTKEAEQLSDKVDKIEEKRKIIELEQNKRKQEEKEINSEELKKRSELLDRELFSNYIIPIEISEQIFNECIYARDKKGIRMVQFMQEKGFERKEKKSQFD